MLLLLSVCLLLSVVKIEGYPQYVEEEADELVYNLDNVLNFVLKNYYSFNFDGLLGITLTEANLLKAISTQPPPKFLADLQTLIQKCRQIRLRVLPLLPDTPKRYIIFKRYMLDQNLWNPEPFTSGQLEPLGTYPTWTSETITRNTHARFHGVPTDVCLEEVLRDGCGVSPLCYRMMLEDRNDTGYLLTHRLLYLQVAKLKGCYVGGEEASALKRGYCSLILKEAKTNAHLGYPQPDLFLEQFLCGSEGFSEFLTNNWRQKTIDLQNPNGCYQPNPNPLGRRSATLLKYGCTDHATGLGAAVLALNLRYILTVIVEHSHYNAIR